MTQLSGIKILATRYGLICLCLSGVLMASQTSFAQIEVTFETTENTNCAGSECDYEGPGILINEIMMSPTSFDGSLWGGLSTQAGEWIELYNPDFCEPVDVSCYYLGNSASDGLLYPGGYVIPAGIVVPAAGFLVIRGVNAAPVPGELLVENGGNTIELVVESDANITGQVCVGAGSRLWFPNAGGWFAFYDSFGEPQDAVRWASAPASALAGQPCVPPFPSCQSANSLVSYNDFPEDRKENIYSGNSAADFQGQSFRRIPDGGVWSGAADATYGTCNAECVDPIISTCNGTATLTATGGSGEYVYQWDDAQAQTTPTAIGLCAQEYCVLVVDGSGNSTTECVTIEEPSYETEDDDTFCEGDTYLLPDGEVVSEGGTFEMMLLTNAGCDSLVTLDLELFPSYSFELNPEICENSSYILPDGEEVNEPGTYTVNFQLDSGCDSTYVVNLNVEPVINVDQQVSICEGEVHVLPDGNEVGTAGVYEVPVTGFDCDTLFVVDLNVDPAYLIQSEVSICEGESHQLPDGTVVDESGIYTIELQTLAGCDSVLEALVLVNPIPEISIPMSDQFCFQPGTITVNATPPGGTLSGLGGLVDGNTVELNNAPAGTYTVNYTYSDENGCNNEADHTFTILPEVNPAFTYNADCFNVARFTNQTPDPEGELEYIWTINDTVFSNGLSPEYAYDEAGDYTVSLTAINTANCPYTTSMDVVLQEGLQLTEYWVPDIITPNGDQLNQYLQLMPIENECLEFRITIFNRWGKMVYEMTETSVPFQGLNEAGVELDEGVYFYLLESPQVDCSVAETESLCKGNIHVVR